MYLIVNALFFCYTKGKGGDTVNKKGLTMIEALASIMIVSIVMVTTMSILVNSRMQARVNQERLIAAQVGVMLSNAVTAYMSNPINYNALVTLIGDQDTLVLNANTCSTSFDANFCDRLYSSVVNGKSYDDQVITIQIYFPISGIIKVTLDINYHLDRIVSIEGFIYG